LPVLLAFSGCASATGPDPCDIGSAEPLGDGVCLVFEDGGQLSARRAQIEQAVRQTLPAVRAVMPISDVRIRILLDPGILIPEIGMGGFTPNGTEVRIAIDPASPHMAHSIATALFPLLAHELHHARRWQTVGYGSTLLEAMVAEGLADHFSIEVAGTEPPPWSVALSGADLETWTDRVRADWSSSPYDHAAWFFGADPAIPRWAGYAIGFEMVRAYLSANSSRRASGLFAEPASSFVSAAAGQ
jgi:hypothetical protein